MAGNKKALVVADAAVIIKWFVDEEHTKKALALRQNYIDGKVDIACPNLLPYEVMNALRYNPDFGVEQSRAVAEALEKYQLWLYPILGELAVLSIKNSYSFGITLYDSAYVSLAEYLDSPFYTADNKILDKVGGRAERFRHISDF